MAGLGIHELIDTLSHARHGTKGDLVRRFARQAGLSVGQVYRHIQAERGTVRPRKAKTRVTSETIEAIEAVRVRCSDPAHKRYLPADVAIEIAESGGLIEPGAVSAGQFHRRSRRAGLRRTRRVVRYQARASNELHHVDASGAVYLRQVTRNGQALVAVDVPRESRKNRPDSKRRQLWVYGVIDDHSRVAVARYVMAPAENSSGTRDVLAWAWGEDEDARHPLCGLPDRLCADNGPFINSGEGKQFLRSLIIEHVPRTPHNPRAGGKIERPWRTLWSRFELQFLMWPDRLMTLDELNAELANYLVRENARAHPWEPGLTRTAVYLRDRGEIRALPDGYLRASFRPDRRTVRKDGVIQFENGFYRAPDELLGERVHVYRSADGRIACAGDDGMVYAMEPFVPHPAGEFHTPKPQPGDAIAIAADELPAMPSLYAEADAPATIPIPARSRQVQLDTPFDRAGRFATSDDAMLYLGQKLGMPVAALGEANVETITERILEAGLSCEFIDELADKIRDGMTAG